MTERLSVGEWDSWWTSRGEPQLTLLLWAVWNPIGHCPLDEYSAYSSSVVKLLRQHYDADELPGLIPLEGRAAELASRLAGDLPPSEREALYREFLEEVNAHPAERNEGVERLADLFAQLRDRMACNPDQTADRDAAETLRKWYWWEMGAGP